ncbi:hypothetical protein, partial [Helicobacter pylori]|uniref:hypothetical protein n=1 Tax=Helicobacter pylori TaxID=210 RepID=UPI00112DC72F
RTNQDFLKAYSLFSSFNNPFSTRAVFYNQNKSFFHYIDLKAILWYFLVFKAFALNITPPTILYMVLFQSHALEKAFLIFKLRLIVLACFKG